jgi:hypothetical protein
MVDIDLSKLDLSKLVPVKQYSDLVAFVPGLFFEFSILLANPEIIARLVSKSQEALALGHYSILCIALFLAFVIGNIFSLIDILIQYLLGFVIRFQRFIWRQLWRVARVPVFGTRVLGSPRLSLFLDFQPLTLDFQLRIPDRYSFSGGWPTG